MSDTLLINACVRPESRTKMLADYLIEKLGASVEEVNLEKESLIPLTWDLLQQREAALAERTDGTSAKTNKADFEADNIAEMAREKSSSETDSGDESTFVAAQNQDILKYAKQFAEAERIVIAAPHWDLSFPASLKTYVEYICAIGVTFDYNEQGQPFGLCNAKELWFVTTAGGPILSDEPGFGYIQALCQRFFGIPKLHYIKAEGLDIVGADVEEILAEARRRIDGSVE